MKTTTQLLTEIYGTYPHAIEDMVAHLAAEASSGQLIGDTTDETLQRVYKHAGELQMLHKVHQWFKKGV